MEYVELDKAVLRATRAKKEEVVKTVCEYVEAREEDVRKAMKPLIKLWEKSDESKKPIVCIWRHLATSQFESYAVLKIANKINGIPLWLTYMDDIFSKNNSEKIVFENVKLFDQKGKNVKKLHLYANRKDKSIDKQLDEIEGKPFRNISTKTENNISLVDYHLELRKKAGFKDENIIDLGEIFEKLVYLSSNWRINSHCDCRPCKDWYYPLWMIMTSKMVVLEDFEVCKDEMKDLIECSYRQAVEKELNPNFVRLDGEKSLDWYMTKPEKDGGVPDAVKKIIEEMK